MRSVIYVILLYARACLHTCKLFIKLAYKFVYLMSIHTELYTLVRYMAFERSISRV